MNKRSMMYVGVMIVSAAAAQVAAADSAEQAVLAAEHQMANAVQTNNAELYASLLADKYVATDETGTIGKDGDVADFKSSTYTSLELTDMKVTAFGDTAIVTGTFATKGTAKGKPFDSRGYFTDTWVKLNGKWLCVADAVSHIKT